ncbi:hypothetical protein Tco_0032274 [Tanacetum coccineum]
MVELDSSCKRSFHKQMKNVSEHIHRVNKLLRTSAVDRIKVLVDDQVEFSQRSCIQESMEYSATSRNCCISQLYEILEQVEQLELLDEPCGILYDDMK